MDMMTLVIVLALALAFETWVLISVIADTRRKLKQGVDLMHRAQEIVHSAVNRVKELEGVLDKEATDADPTHHR